MGDKFGGAMLPNGPHCEQQCAASRLRTKAGKSAESLVPDVPRLPRVGGLVTVSRSNPGKEIGMGRLETCHEFYDFYYKMKGGEVVARPEERKEVGTGLRERDFYIDCLRSVMIALVILHHTAITYGASGGWFHHELPFSGRPSSVILSLFCTIEQAYIMGILFLLAGYFTPGSLERKGYACFLGARNLRLGVPLTAFVLILGPVTNAMVSAAEGKGFWSGSVLDIGPLWFNEALLIFGLAYCAWRTWFGAPLTSAQRAPRPVPSYGWWLLSAVGVGAAALAIRQVVPVGVNVIGLQLGYFASYVFLFCLGIAAWRYDWFRQLKWKHASPWIITLAVAGVSWPAIGALATTLNGPGKSNFSGGLSWTAIFYAFWEPFIAWGIISAWLLVFRRYMNRPSGFWTWLNRRSFAVYIIHPVVLVGISLLLSGWTAPALVKFVVTGSLSCVACWILADPLVRTPGVRRVV
ncbi:MAG: acyltransferase family protein [Verrucomicrobia bacterium]|nr:acyltransferase family protein [Verrucomicrobiota bacterium]